MNTRQNLVCTVLLITGLFATASAQAEAPSVDLLLGSQGTDVRLMWTPNNWPKGLEGFDLKRRPPNGKWVQLGPTFKPTSKRLESYLTPEKIHELNKSLMLGFTDPLAAGFGYHDKSLPETTGSEFNYGLFPVIKGKTSREPIAVRTWFRGNDENLDVGLRVHENAWNPDLREAAFALDMDKVFSNSLRYGFIEQRAGQNPATPIMMSTASPMKLDQKFVCHRPKQPDPVAVVLVIEDKFGFQSTASMEIPTGTGPRSSGYVMPSLCGGPAVAVPVSPPPPSPPPPPRR